MHVFIRAKDVKPVPEYVGHSKGYRRFKALPDGTAVHTDIGICELDADGHIEMRVQSYEETFYVTEGNPILITEGRAVRLVPGACGVILTGVPHAWKGSGEGTSKWIENLTPRPRAIDSVAGPDTFFVGSTPDLPVEELDIRDPRSRHLFRMRDEDIDLDKLKAGSRVNAPTVSASMATAVLAYSGIAVKMLVDGRMGASQSTMFMVDYQPGAVAHPHDHPLEEAYMMLSGDVEFIADGVKYEATAGDIMWAGVGCVHAFYERKGAKVRWLETASPAPPLQHSYRFSRDWDYLAETVSAGAPVPA